MSGIHFTMGSGEVSLSAATAKTVLGLAAASNHRAHVHEIRIGFKGTTVSNEPVTVEEIRFTSDGTGTAGTALKRDADASESVEATWKYNYTVEPTGVTVLSTWYIHPQTGISHPLPIDKPIPVSGGDFWGIRCTADDAVTCMVHVEAEE